MTAVPWSRFSPGPRLRAVLLVLVALCAAALPLPAQVAVPVLCYHSFTEADSARGLTEPYARFEEMMRFLADNGFRSAFPEDIRRGRADPRRSVVITFDDGGRDQLRAAEIMERYGFRGLFFVIPATLSAGTGPDWRMTAEEMQRLARAGHRVAVHGYRHRSMVASGPETAATLVRSMEELRPALPRRHPVHDFAFPFGHYSDEIAEAVGEEYRYLHTVNPGYWDGRSPMVPRMLLAGDIPLDFFQRYVLERGGYRPTATLLGGDGATGDTLRFRLAEGLPQGELAVLAISADAQERMYNLHPLGDNARVAGDTLVVDLRGHMRRYFPAERRVISYALVVQTAGGTRYLSPGYSQWFAEERAPRPAGAPLPEPRRGAVAGRPCRRAGTPARYSWSEPERMEWIGSGFS